MTSQNSSSTDAQLIQRSRNDPDAFTEICRRHADPLHRWLVRELGDETFAGEIVAETFSEAWFSRARYRDPGSGSAKPWLFGIARNLVYRAHRTRRIESRSRARLGLPVPHPDLATESINRVGAFQQLGSLDRQLDQLPKMQRRALELRVVDELAYAEIGELLSITPEGARTRVFRALDSLRNQIGRN